MKNAKHKQNKTNEQGDKQQQNLIKNTANVTKNIYNIKTTHIGK